ncbi:MAG: DUF167 domain-containing protein [Anaerolineae bacterium]|nr:DUF167 domain-containing protein [Anaerolineae bacterium]
MPTTSKNTSFTNPAGGAALQVHVTTNAKKTSLAQVDRNGLVHVNLALPQELTADVNQVLCQFLAELFGIPITKIEVAAGHHTNDKIVCLLDISVDTVNQVMSQRS